MIILVADDEKLVRLSLKSMIEEISENSYTIIEAKNGKEVINLCNQYHPNLALVDISMPLMDGLSAISICKENCKNTSWFILTGEAEFHLAKKAISLGINDYILKPISLDQLKNVINKVKNNMSYLFSKKNNDFELSVISTINSLQNNNTYINTHQLSNEKYSCYLLIIDKYLSIENTITSQNILYDIKIKINTIIKDDINFACFYLDTNKLCIIFKSNLKTNLNLTPLLDSLKMPNYCFTLFEGDSYSNLLDTYNGLLILDKFSHIRILNNLNTVISLDKFILTNDTHKLDFSKEILILCDAYNKRNQLLYSQSLDNIKNNLNYKKVYPEINTNNLLNFLKIFIEFVGNIETFNDLTKNLSNHMLDAFSSSHKASNSNLIDEIINYVDKHYMNNIGINTISTLYGITPNYLSKIFHEKSGLKFIEYITKIRLQKSKKLISENPRITIKEVSELVGYNSPRHFSKIFFKYEGFYPSELLKTIK